VSRPKKRRTGRSHWPNCNDDESYDNSYCVVLKRAPKKKRSKLRNYECRPKSAESQSGFDGNDLYFIKTLLLEMQCLTCNTERLQFKREIIDLLLKYSDCSEED